MFFPTTQLTLSDKKVLSEDEKKTQEYDQLAFRIVSYFAAPGLVIYSIYSCKFAPECTWPSTKTEKLT